MIKFRTISPKGGWPIRWFFLIVLLNLAGACNKSKKRSGQPRFSAPPSGAELPPFLPNANAASSLSNVEHVPPVPNNSVSGQENQPKIIEELGEMIQKKIKENDTFSQKLSTITDPSERDKLLGPFVKAYNRRVDDFNLLLQKVINPNEKQRLISSFQDIQTMCNEFNALNAFNRQSCPADQKKNFQKYGDIVEKYHGYRVESKRGQIKRRLQELVKYVTDNQPMLQDNQAKKPDQCAICHSSIEPLALLPCRDSVHLNCLAEEMIFVWRQGFTFVLTCPGSCNNIIAFHYFLLDDDAYVKKYLTPDGLKEVFCKPNSK